MSPDPTHPDLDALEEAEAKATPRPWKAIPWPATSTVTSMVVWGHEGAYSPTEITGVVWSDIATLIALSRNALPGLLAMSRRTLAAEAECTELRAELESERSDPRPRRDWTDEEIRSASR